MFFDYLIFIRKKCFVFCPAVKLKKVISYVRTTIFEELKVQSYRSYNNKYTITLTQITNSEIFEFIAVLVFKLLSRKVLFINKKGNRNC